MILKCNTRNSNGKSTTIKEKQSSLIRHMFFAINLPTHYVEVLNVESLWEEKGGTNPQENCLSSHEHKTWLTIRNFKYIHRFA